jgi:hypothetical protein
MPNKIQASANAGERKSGVGEMRRNVLAMDKKGEKDDELRSKTQYLKKSQCSRADD